jgi:DNA repair photolyase
MLRLPYRVDELFQLWLQAHYPQKKERILSLVREVRGGMLKDPRFGSRMRGEGAYAEQIAKLFQIYRRKLNLERKNFSLSTNHFLRPHSIPKPQRQLSLF